MESPKQGSGAPDLVDVLAEVVVPALRRMVRPAEVDDLALSWVSEALELRITLRRERFAQTLWEPSWPPWSAPEARGRLESDLQDFVAESAFGWGEARGGEQ